VDSVALWLGRAFLVLGGISVLIVLLAWGIEHVVFSARELWVFTMYMADRRKILRMWEQARADGAADGYHRGLVDGRFDLKGARTKALEEAAVICDALAHGEEITIAADAFTEAAHRIRERAEAELISQ
jgi:hypothetical protein